MLSHSASPQADIPNLPALLRAVPAQTVCRLQQGLARFYRAILWQKPFGAQLPAAYELAMVSLCRRAKALAAELAASGAHREAFLARRPLDCADTLEAAGIQF